MDLNNLLKKKINYSFSKSLLHSISNIIQGDVEYDELNENLKYLRNDGKFLNLLIELQESNLFHCFLFY